MDTGAILDALGYLAAGLGSLIEGAGIAFPGQVILLTAAAWAAARHGSLALVILIGFAGATAGADIGYYISARFKIGLRRFEHRRVDTLGRENGGQECPPPVICCKNG